MIFGLGLGLWALRCMADPALHPSFVPLGSASRNCLRVLIAPVVPWTRVTRALLVYVGYRSLVPYPNPCLVPHIWRQLISFTGVVFLWAGFLAHRPDLWLAAAAYVVLLAANGWLIRSGLVRHRRALNPFVGLFAPARRSPIRKRRKARFRWRLEIPGRVGRQLTSAASTSE